jgi:hypothetical protein
VAASDVNALAEDHPSGRAPLGGAVQGLPAGVATAALQPEPALPVPDGWAFPDQFSRTSGTGRMVGGAFEWTDWVYDAFGAAGLGPTNSDLSGVRGVYTYPPGPANADGADIFRAAVALTSTGTVWRIDWNTLVDPSVPIAEWTFDTDNNPTTGASQWPADANVSSPGIDKALVVSAKGAELIDPVTHKTIASLSTTVHMSARSFVVSVPRSTLPVSRMWRVRLAAGLADTSGTAFAVPTLSGGQAPAATAPRVYNISFRSAAQEPGNYAAGRFDSAVAQIGSTLRSLPIAGAYGANGAANLVTGNSWGDADQADTLASGDVSKFSQAIDWVRLADKVETQPPLIYGWTTRWYVTDLNLGQGIDTASQAEPQLLGRIQPYAVYVPGNYHGTKAAPLTWLLHGSMLNYNWAAGGNPRLSQEACQDRGSICLSSEGFGPTGYFIGDAEHDFWQVWRQAALSFNLDQSRTVISGYSMGGLGTFVLATTYPSDFSEAMPLDGGFDEGCSTLSKNGLSEEIVAAAPDRTPNVRSVPMVISNADTDELSPYPNLLVTIQRYEAARDRFTLFSTTGGDHVATLAEDGFSTQVAALHGAPASTNDPGTIDYTWCPEVVDHNLGLGPTSLYWLSGLSEHNNASGAISHIVANDAAIPEPAETEQLYASVVDPPDAPPMQLLKGSWTSGATPPATSIIKLTLTNVATLTIDTAAAKLPTGAATVDTDGATTLTLSALAPGTVVQGPGGVVRSGPVGHVTLNLPQGDSKITWTG